MTDPVAAERAQLLADLKTSDWFKVGWDSADAHLNRKDWLYRRVESLHFRGRRTMRRHVSVDFEMPKLPHLGNRAPKGGRLVPISVFAKWPPLEDFDLIGPDGQSCSLYTRDTNKRLDLGLLLGMAAKLADLPRLLQGQLAALVVDDDPPPDAVGAFTANLRATLRAANPDAGKQMRKRIADTVNLAAQLANSSILWVPVTATRGSDCIVKFSYLTGLRPPSGLRRLLIACSWYDRVLLIPLPHAGQYTRYHLDLDTANAAVEFVRVQTLALPGEPREFGSEELSSEVQPLGTSEIVDRHAHVYHPLRTAPSHRVALQLVIAATREGFISGCLMIALALALLMSIAYHKLGGAAHHLEPFVVLLAAVLGYLLVRVEDPLEREGVIGVRAMVLLAGLMPIVGALTLVFARERTIAGKQHLTTSLPALDVARPVWAALMILSWLLVIGLGWSWALACSGKDGSRNVRPGNVLLTSSLFAALFMLLGSSLETQPYTHTVPARLVHYLHTNRPLVIAGAAALVVGVSALHPLLGAIRRVARQQPQTTRGRRARALGVTTMFTAAALWIWGTMVALALTIWVTLTPNSVGQVQSFMHDVNVLANVTLAPAEILIIGVTAWLVHYHNEIPGNRVLVVLGGAIGGTLVLLRGAAVLWPFVLSLAPRWAWLGLAVWVASTALMLRYSVKFEGPRSTDTTAPVAAA
jgi:hypothetical protein